MSNFFADPAAHPISQPNPTQDKSSTQTSQSGRSNATQVCSVFHNNSTQQPCQPKECQANPTKSNPATSFASFGNVGFGNSGPGWFGCGSTDSA